MRQGIVCVLHEAEAGSLAEVRRCLDGWRFVCRDADSAGAPEQEPAASELQIVELCGDAAPILARQRTGGGPSLALCRQDDAKALSLAASLGFDDALIMPLDPVELVRRLQTLAAFAALGAERSLRTRLFASYRDEKPHASHSPADRSAKPEVAVLGKADDHQVRVVAALPSARVTYVEIPGQLPTLLRASTLDLVLVTQPALIVAALEAVEAADGEAPMLLAAHSGPPTALELPPQVDLLPLPAPMALARMRLALALRMGEIRRWLHAPPLGEANAMVIDALTGLYNQGAFLDYLSVTGEHRALVGLEPDRLEQLNRATGYAAGNRALARLGRELARSLRADDFAAHLGGGRFAVAVAVSSRQQLERLRYRLEAAVAAGEPWHVLTAAEGWPARGAPAQRLARLFGDLRRLRPAA